MATSGPRQLLGGWRKEKPKEKTPPPFVISAPIVNLPSTSNPGSSSGDTLPISSKFAKSSSAAAAEPPSSTRNPFADRPAIPPRLASRGDVVVFDKPLPSRVQTPPRGTAQDALDRLTGKVDDEPKSYSNNSSGPPSPHSRGDYNTLWAPPKKHAQYSALASGSSSMNNDNDSSAAASALPSPISDSPLMPPPSNEGSRRVAVPALHENEPSPPATPPRGAPPLHVPRYDNRGYRVKTGSEISQTSSTTPASLSPNSSRPPTTTRSPSSADEFSRYPNEGDFAPTPTPPPFKYPAPRGTGRLAAPGVVGTVPELSTNDVPSYYDEKKGTKSIDSHFTYSDAHMDRWEASRGDPRPAQSISDSSESGFEKGGDLVYNDFGINLKNGRRQVVSMLNNPHNWAYLGPEDDDDFHNPDIKSKQTGIWGSLLTVRGFTNVGCLFMLTTTLVVLFAGYPIITATLAKTEGTLGAFNMGGINASGQLPDVGPFALIDADTPPSAYKHVSMETGEEWDLVFSDEFNRDGRSFYPGDDPYWEAEDYHYWGTENLNWYDPAFITTRNGSLVIRLDKYPQHDLDYTGGLMSTWNRFCFTGGYIETRLTLPGRSDVAGLWPAVWTLGNLGRAGYGGTLEGMWPYTYDSCDRGTLPNQTLNGLPKLTYDEGDVYKDGDFNYLPGQRLSRCTCQNSASQHPGPKHDDGSFVGRSAPEIDIIEAQVGDADEEGDHTGVWSGHVSMSGQWAPFNPGYRWLNSSEYFTLYNKSAGWINTYQGGTLQQSTSVLMKTNQDCYEMNTGCMSIYGFEYEPTSKGYISWVNDGQKAFTVRGGAMGPNARANVSERPVPEEPMYIVMNLGISEAFGGANTKGLEAYWPVEMHIDYIRVYQDPAKRNIGCDPANFPTAAYIDKYKQAYFNPNISTFAQLMDVYPDAYWPKNNLVDGCE